MYSVKDYFIPDLGPYVEWVKVYRQLISALYSEHRTVRKTWNAFRNAVPGIEHRLQFEIFEQILLFSLFLSEWNQIETQSGLKESEERSEHRKPAGLIHKSDGRGDELDKFIQSLHKTMDETNNTLNSLALHREQSALSFEEQESVLENRIIAVDQSLGILRNEIETEDDQLRQVIQEMVDGVSSRMIALREDAARRDGSIQSVIQWSRQDDEGAVIQNIEPKVPLKIGKWNVQRSKDGYYRLYRKVGGKVHSIYVGKDLDLDKAERRIADREKAFWENNRANEPNEIGIQIEMKAQPRIIVGDG